jgi:WD40 repeat protein
MKLTYPQIIAQHQTLQKTEAAPVAPERVGQVKAFIADVVSAGADIADPRQREQLRSILRYWSAYVYDQTKEFPPSQLAPFSGTGAGGSRLNLISAGPWLIAGAAVLVIIIFFVLQTGAAGRVNQIAATASAEAVVAAATDQAQALILTTTAGAGAIQPTATALPATDTLVAVDTPTQIIPPTPTRIPSATPTYTPGPSPTPTATQPPRVLAKLSPKAGAVYGVAFSPDNKLLAAGGGNGVVTLWDVSGIGEPPLVATLIPGASVLDIAFSPDGAYLAMALLDNTAQVWQVSSPPKRIIVLEGHTGSVTSVDFSPDGTILATAGIDERVKLWNVGPWNEFNSPPLAANPLIRVVFSPEGRLLAYGGTGTRIFIWDLVQERLAATLSGPFKAGRSLGFSRDGLFLVAGSYDGSIRLWKRASTDSAEFTAIKEPVEKSGAGYDVVFSPTDVLAVAREDGSIDLWEVRTETKTLLATLAGQHKGVVRSLAFSSDGNWLASGGSDQTVVIWAVR